MANKKNAEVLFWNKVDIKNQNTCWEWCACKSWKGYGIFRFNGRNTNAQRVSYELKVGVIPKGLYVLHKCNNRGCVNPKHLFLGTAQDNSSDMVRKQRQARGEKLPQAKLKEKDILEIRNMYKSKEKNQPQLSLLFGVGPHQISRIINKLRWAHI